MAGARIDRKRVVGAAIHPSIGIARIGNSQNEWFFRSRGYRSAPRCAGILPRADRLLHSEKLAQRFNWCRDRLVRLRTVARYRHVFREVD
jgi:hypothetical protein